MPYSKSSYTQLYIKMVRSRITLEQLVHEFGLHHPKVISYSQEMDRLVNELQKKKQFVLVPEQ